MTAAPAGLLVALTLLLLTVAGFCAAGETAFPRTSRAEAHRQAADGRRGGLALARVLDLGPPAQNVMVFVRIACETAALVCGVLAIDRWLDRWWAVLLVSAAVLAVLTFITTGVAPRTLARQHPLVVARLLAPSVRVAALALGPFVAAVVALGNAVTPGRGFRHGPFASEDEFRGLVDIASESEVIEDEERRMIQSVFEIGDTLVREVMVPRPDVDTIEAGTTLQDAMPVFLSTGRSRIPVVGPDGLDRVLGVLYVKDVARRLHSGHTGNDLMPVERAVRPPVFVPESQTVESLLRQMRGRSANLALVVDEYGGTAGLVTIEDLVEEIVGEIADEYDREPEPLQQIGENTFVVTARMDLDTFTETFDLDLPDEDEDEVDSVGGLLALLLGKVPEDGDSIEQDGLELTAQCDPGHENRLMFVQVRRLPRPDTPAEDPDE